MVGLVRVVVAWERVCRGSLGGLGARGCSGRVDVSCLSSQVTRFIFDLGFDCLYLPNRLDSFSLISARMSVEVAGGRR